MAAVRKYIKGKNPSYDGSSIKEEIFEEVFDGSEIIDVMDENLLIVHNNLGVLGVIKRDDISEYVKIPRDELANCRIVDKKEGRAWICNHQGLAINYVEAQDSEYDLEPFTSDGNLFHEDYFGKNLMRKEKVEEKKEKKEKNFSFRRPLNLYLINLSLINRRKFWEIYNDPVAFTSDSNIDILIKTAILQSGQFDEIFTIETDKPESPLMKKYLEKLSELVNKQLSILECDGLDNMEELQKIAYQFAGYEGKTLQTVIEEAKDYHAYFRYLLTRGEKIVVTEKQKEYFDNLSNLYDKEYKINPSNLHYRSNRLNNKIEETIEYSEPFYFKETIPYIDVRNKEIFLEFFTFVDNIKEIYEVIESSPLSLKIALINELVQKEYSDKIKQGINVITGVFVCDKEYNYMRFTVKKSTLIRWKKNLKDKITESTLIFNDGPINLPYGFSEYVI